MDYISRVKNLRFAIFDARRRSRGSLDHKVVIEIDLLTARSFFSSSQTSHEARILFVGMVPTYNLYL